MSTGAAFQPDPPSAWASTAGSAIPSRALRRAVWRTAVRWGRALAATVFVATALVGAAVTPWWWMLLFAPVLGALAGGTVAVVDPDFPREPSSRRLVCYAVGVGVLLLPFGTALPALGDAGGLTAVVLLGVGSLVAADRLPDDDAPPPVRDVTALGAVLPGRPPAELVGEWMATEELLRAPRHRSSAAEVRDLLLEELTRRDPAGVARWLAAGAASPRPYIRVDGDLPG